MAGPLKGEGEGDEKQGIPKHQVKEESNQQEGNSVASHRKSSDS